MANEFDNEELIDLRRFTGYGQPLPNVDLDAAAALLEDVLAAMSDETAGVVRSAFLEPLRAQYRGLVSSHENMDDAELGPIKRNANVLSERLTLLNSTRRALVAFLGVPNGPDLRPAPGFVLAKAVR